MATLHDRAIEDKIMLTLASMWKRNGKSMKTIASEMGVSEVTIWQWTTGGMSFPNSLARLRRLVEVSGAKLDLKITSRDDGGFTF